MGQRPGYRGADQGQEERYRSGSGDPNILSSFLALIHLPGSNWNDVIGPGRHIQAVQTYPWQGNKCPLTRMRPLRLSHLLQDAAYSQVAQQQRMGLTTRSNIDCGLRECILGEGTSHSDGSSNWHKCMFSPFLQCKGIEGSPILYE